MNPLLGKMSVPVPLLEQRTTDADTPRERARKSGEKQNTSALTWFGESSYVHVLAEEHEYSPKIPIESNKASGAQ